ncbi:MAG TPA: WbqC family protein [Chryseolinea sp.]|nr:WbqC family protein [Chryseolinea sp.]HPM29626.1 WbqC family protein [Chryseolinea sp.]
MSSILIEAQYLPPIAYFTAIQHATTIIIEKHEHFQKQSYRNRCYILTSQTKEMLILPLTSKHGNVCITDIKVDYSQKWLNHHWRSIQSAYGRAPFFEYYADELEKVLFSKHTYLYDLNYQLLSMCLRWLKWNVTVEESLAYEKTIDNSITDLRSLINPKKTDMEEKFYKSIAYTQVFGSTFVKNLSLIDLIFCEGPAASRLIEASAIAK